jgi:hypothetical protein
MWSSFLPLLRQETECGARRGRPYRGRNSVEEAPVHFRITGLPAETFTHLFDLSDDSREGDELILDNYEHHPVESPYRMRFAIYVRRGEATYDAVDAVPEQLRTRTLALRAYDTNAMMVGWDLADGRQLIAAIERMFADPRAAYLHVHYAAPGCYAAKVERA